MTVADLSKHVLDQHFGLRSTDPSYVAECATCKDHPWPCHPALLAEKTRNARTCSECGTLMNHPNDSGHDECLHCRLPDLMEAAYQRGREDAVAYPQGSTFAGGPR